MFLEYVIDVLNQTSVQGSKEKIDSSTQPIDSSGDEDTLQAAVSALAELFRFLLKC